MAVGGFGKGVRAAPYTEHVGADLGEGVGGGAAVFATAGRGGADLTPFAAENFPWLRNPSFANMTAPALVVVGDRDNLPLTDRGPDWMTDPYFLSPGSKSLLTLFGAEHSLGGISGYEAKETTDENPRRVALVQRLTWAYLRHALDIDDSSWVIAQKTLPGSSSPPDRIESK